MKIAIIVAHSENLVIGSKGELPWHYSEDLKRFKRLTIGHPIIMGRKTYESIGAKPLPDRENIVISRTKSYDNCVCFDSLEKALQYVRNEEMIFIGGGAGLYNEIIDKVDLMYVTVVHKKISGDTFFPEYRNQIGTKWREIHKEDMEDISFIDYERI